MDTRLFYQNNDIYSKFLDSQTITVFKKYIDSIRQHLNCNERYLDVGCGTGIVLDQLTKGGYTRGVGIEVSITSINLCKKKNVSCHHYDGISFPFADGFFDLVGSINVLEHAFDPIAFLNEKYRVLKKNGVLILVCPNFLSITNNYHKNTRGIFRKLLNLLSIIRKLQTHQVNFEKMEMTFRKDFHPDDDAINVTNPFDINKWAKKNNLKTLRYSAFQQDGNMFMKAIDKSCLNIFFGSCFYIFRKV